MVIDFPNNQNDLSALVYFTIDNIKKATNLDKLRNEWNPESIWK